MSENDVTFRDDDIIITSAKLSVSAALSHIASFSCGGSSIFCGTTRDTFQDKAVLYLEYEAYPSMALRHTRCICEALCGVYPGVEKWYVAHRTGRVDVGEISIIVAAASPHRNDAVQFVASAVDKIKESVPIWKKEWYEDGSVWKENHKCGGSQE